MLFLTMKITYILTEIFPTVISHANTYQDLSTLLFCTWYLVIKKIIAFLFLFIHVRNFRLLVSGVGGEEGGRETKSMEI